MANLLRLSACLFVLLSFNAFAVDTDGDGFSDADEATLGTDPNDPTSPLENKLTASDGAANDYFGYSVSIDGDTAVIGAYLDDDNGAGSGSAYVYVRSNGVWIEQAKLTASDGSESDFFGRSVSIAGDTAVIGAYYDDDNGSDSGSVYVFVRSNGVWSEQQKLTASNGASGDIFGSSVSIDGDTAVIGACCFGARSAYVFVRSNGVWSEQEEFRGGQWLRFGESVSIDGDTVLISGHGDGPGQAYVYVRSNGVWSEQAMLTASDRAGGDYFGEKVSIDGETAVIGARWDDDNGDASGSAYVFVRSNGVWSEQQKLTASDGASGDYFGSSVSVDGDTALIINDSNGWSLIHASAYVFVRTNGEWNELAKLTASDVASGDYFGLRASIDGDTALIGAFGDDNLKGSAYSYDLSSFKDIVVSISGNTSASIAFGQSTTGALVATDQNGLTDGTYFSISLPPLHGTAGINTESGFWFYFADPTYIGDDPFTVTITDDLGYTYEQIISITLINPDDLDNDGVNNDNDAFPNDPSETTDTDSDGIGDNTDNCVSVSNVGQLNDDGDAFGNACDDDFDNDGVVNLLDAFPNDPSETSDSDGDGVGDNTDNCINAANFDQVDFDNDTLGDACDLDADNDGMFNTTEDRFGGNNNDETDTSLVIQNMQDFAAVAPADSDLDGVPDDVEAMLGEDNTSSTFQDLLDTLSTIATAKNVPAMGGIGLLALGLSMLGLGAVRLRK